MAKGRSTRLADTEIEILVLTAQGYSAPEIARKLERTTTSVSSVLTRVREKLEAKNTTHAVVIAIRQGLI